MTNKDLSGIRSSKKFGLSWWIVLLVLLLLSGCSEPKLPEWLVAELEKTEQKILEKLEEENEGELDPQTLIDSEGYQLANIRMKKYEVSEGGGSGVVDGGPPPPGSIYEIEETIQEFKESLRKLDEAGESIDAEGRTREELKRRLDVLKQHLEQRIQDLAAESMRGSVKAFRSQAEVQWSLDFLRDLALHLGEVDLIPKNYFELVPRQRLKEWERTTSLQLQRLKTDQTRARFSTATYDALVRHLQQRQDVIAEAKQNDYIALPDRFAHLARQDISEEDRRWVSGRLAKKKEGIDAYERRLLENALVVNPNHVGVALQLLELKNGTGKSTEALWAATAARRARGLAPFGDATRGTVVQMHEGRVFDVVDGLTAESEMRRIFHELGKAAGEGRFGEPPPEILKSFERLAASFLNEAELLLYERRARLALAYVSTAKTRAGENYAGPFEIDLAAIEAEKEAASRELAARQKGSQPRGQVLLLQARGQGVQGLDIRSVDSRLLPTDYAGQLAAYETLERFERRTPMANEFIRKLKIDLEIRGFKSQVSDLEKAAEGLEKSENTLKKRVGETGVPAPIDQKIKLTKTALDQQARRLQNGLQSRGSDDPNRIAELTARVAMLLAPMPPPPANGRAQPFEDAGHRYALLQIADTRSDIDRWRPEQGSPPKAPKPSVRKSKSGPGCRVY